MSAAATDPVLLADVGREARETLHQTLGYCHERFDLYRRSFREAGVAPHAISFEDPVEVLRRLPTLGAEGLRELSEASLQAGDAIVDLETSSGTTGTRKRRFISFEDDVSDHLLLAEMFRGCGVDGSDRVACIDTDPVNLMASFTRAFDLLGAESYMLCAGPDLRGGLACLPRLEPSVLVTVPSILERSVSRLISLFSSPRAARPERVIYVGEELSGAVRRRLEVDLGVEVFGYYGASETSALGIECSSHDGIHLFEDRNVIEMAPDAPDSHSGEIVVTTLHQKTLPLLRYRLGDLIQVLPGACPCGRRSPRVEVRGRPDEVVSIWGAKLGFRPVLEAAYRGFDVPGPMQLVLTRDKTEKLTVVLPEAMSSRRTQIVDSLLAAEPDLDFLVESKYLELELSFVEAGLLRNSRKRSLIVDLRRGDIGDPDYS